METFSALLARYRRIPRTKGQWCGALMFSFMCAWISGWVNSRAAGYLRHHRAHYDVTAIEVPLTRVIYLPTSFAVALQVQEQTWHCHSANEVTLKDMGKTDQYQTTTKSQDNLNLPYHVHDSWDARGPHLPTWIDTSRPRQNVRHFTDDIFKCIFVNENVWNSLKFSLKFLPKVRIDNIPALLQIMAWRRPGDKPLSELMMVSLPTHICVTQPQWVNYMYHPCMDKSLHPL